MLMKEKIKILKRLAYWAVFTALITLTGLVAISTLNIPGNYRLFVVLSGSMEPRVKTGSLVVVKQFPNYQKGDLITFADPVKPKETVTHRIFEVKEAPWSAIYTTKGDANKTPDPTPVPAALVLGKALFVLPLIGFMVSFAKTQLGFIVLIVVPAVMIIYNEILTIKKEALILMKQRKKRKLALREEAEEKIGEEIMTLEKTIKKLTVVLLLSGLLLAGQTRSALSDREVSAGNTFAAATLDFSLTASPFNLSSLQPGGSQSRAISIIKTGSRDFSYNVSAINFSEDTNLCHSLQMEVKLGGLTKYNGSLAGLTLSPVVMIGGSGQDDWTFTLSLSDSDSSLQAKTCGFDLKFRGWQTESSGSWGLSNEEITSGSSVTTSCWIAPTAGQDTPADGTVTSASIVNFGWHKESSTCSLAAVTYQLRIFADSSRTTSVFESLWGTATGLFVSSLSDGEYYWDIQAKDQYGNTSNTSLRHLTIDRISPSAPFLSVTGSWTKVVSQSVTNSDFTGGLSGWTTAGDVKVATIGGTTAAQIGSPGYPGDLGNYVWENRLMQSFPSGAKSLLVGYNFFTNDFAGYDDPGFMVRLNGQQVFSLAAAVATASGSTGWREFVYDLSNYNNPLNLAVYSGNTGDTYNQSWAYIRQVSTYYVAAPAHATYHLSANDPGSGLDHCDYRTDSHDWQTGEDFTVPDAGTHTIQYYCADRAGNATAINQATVVTDVTAPAKVSDLEVTNSDYLPNSLTLSWKAPGNDGNSGRAAQYDVRYQTTVDPAHCSDFNFDTATKMDKVPGPKDAGETETLEVLGLNPSTNYCFALKAADEAPNWSDMSNLYSGRTADPSPGESVSNGDIVINELMWMGTGAGSNDEYLELRNMTNRTINLSGFKLLKYDGTDMGVDFSGKSIGPQALFLVTYYAPGSSSSRLSSSVSADLVDRSLTISNSSLEITLEAPGGMPVDVAGDGGAPTAGLYDSSTGRYYSMERTDVPGIGTDPLNWYTCIDSASTADFFTGVADDRGTPGATNRSENEPVPEKTGLPIVAASPSATASVSAQVLAGSSGQIASPSATVATSSARPRVDLKLTSDQKTITFTVDNTSSYTLLHFELTYGTSTSPQGVIGDINPANQPSVSRDILLGTCSTGGTCVYHQSVQNFRLIITLMSPDGSSFDLEKTL